MSAPETFLLAFHQAHPGCTSEAFARGRVGDTGSSYDLLADCLPQPIDGRVLDLGCGDGHLLELLTRKGLSAEQLVGLDMSPDELRLARARPALARSSLLHARAQGVPLADGDVSVVVSHLAFMLMSDIDQVVAEVHRVLEPGGVFATLVGGGPKVGDAFELFLDLLLPILRRVGNPVPRLGDPRCRSEEGLNELLGPTAGFAVPRIEDFAVDLSGTPAQVWQTLSTIYELFELPGHAEAELRSAFTPAARALSRDGHTVPCSMFVRRVLTRRAQ